MDMTESKININKIKRHAGMPIFHDFMKKYDNKRELVPKIYKKLRL